MFANILSSHISENVVRPFSHGPSLRGPWSTDGNSSPYNLTDPEYNPAAPQYNPTDPQYNLAELQPSN